MKPAIFLSVLLTWVCNTIAQADTAKVYYFNRAYQQEKDIAYVTYIGTAEKITDKIYQVTFYTLDGVKMAMGEYPNNRFKHRHGVFVVYNQDGQIVLSSTYVRGHLDGPFLRFHSNGRLSDSGYVKKGTFSGKWMSWYDNGQPKLSCNYSRILTRYGREVSFLKDEYKSWFADGQLDDSGFYKNNQKEGIWVDWLDSGRVKSVGLYHRNWKKGIWRYYDAGGKLLYMRRFSKFKYDVEGEYIPIAR